MAERKLQLILAIKADGTVAIDKVAGQLDRVGDEADRASKKTGNLRAALGRIGGEGASLVAGLATQFAMAGVAAGGLAAAVVGVGVKHNAQLEQAKLAMAALMTSMGEIRDANGRVLEGQEKWNASLLLSTSLTKKLQVAALQTTAEFGDLVRVMQEGMGPAIQAGFDETQIVKFVQMIAQTGGALGIAGDRLGQEIRAVLAGEKGPDNQIANALFGDMKDVKAKLAELKESGKLFDFLEEKMAGFVKAGESAADTFGGALSNLKDAITQALGEATLGATGDLTTQLKELTAQIVTFDEQGRATFNKDFVDGVQVVASALTTLAGTGVTLVESLPKFELFFSSLREWAKENEHYLEFAGQIANPATPFLAATKNPITQLNMLNDVFGEGGKGYTSLDDILTQNVRKQRESKEMRGRSLEEELELTGSVSSLDAGIAKGGPTLGAKAGGGGGGGEAAAEKLRKQLDDYKAWVDEAKALADAAGDPLQEALAKIEADRLAAIAKIDEANKKIKGALELSDVAKAANESLFDQKAIDAIVKQWEVGLKERAKVIEEADKAAADSAAATGKILGDIQRSVEDDRIATIEDAVERELQTRLAGNDDWYEQMLATVEKEITVQEEKDEVLEKLAKEKKRRDEAAAKEAEKLRREDIAGTEEWARKVRATIKQNLGSIAQDMAGVIGDSTQALRGAFDELFAGIVDGQLDIGDTLKNLGKNLGNIWGQMLSNMLTRTLATGESITSQLKGMWDTLGGTTGVDAAMGGAGIGSLVGGLGAAILGPGNYAGEGGAIGGALGAVIGAYFGSPQIGAMIGSVIGTAVGGAIGKDGDWIKVAIKDGILTVTEEGLSADGRQQLERELKEAISEQVKGWNSILELFPVEMQQQLKDLVKPLEINGGIEGGDIKDSGAMQALSDFLTDTLNRNLYFDYIMAIEAGLAGIGVSDERIKQMFKEWGALQGEELQGAVREYIETLVESVRVRDLFKPFDLGTDGGDIRGAARDALAAQRPEQRLRSMIGDLGVLVANLPKLDPSDQIAAMQQVNQLGQQIWDNMIAQLQRIDAIQQGIANSAQSLRDQITLTGLDDQGKMDWYFDQLSDLRNELKMTNDPEEIARITQQAFGFISSALALDPGNEDLRAQLMSIIGDFEGLSDEQLGEARDRVMEEQLKAYELLAQAAQMLLDAVDGIPVGPAPPPTPPSPPDPDDPKPKDPKDPFAPLNIAAQGSASELDAFSKALVAASDSLGAKIGDLVSLAPSPSELDAVYASLVAARGSLGAVGGGFVSLAPPPSTIPGYAAGLDYVPYDNYIARLHQGERVLPASAAREADRRGGSGAVAVTVELSGPGADFMQQVGIEVQRSVIRTLQNNPRITNPNYDA